MVHRGVSGVLLLHVGQLASLKLPCLQALLVELFYEPLKNVLSAGMHVNVQELEKVCFLPPTFTETSWAVTLLFTKVTGQQVLSGAIKRIGVPSFLHQLRVLPSLLPSFLDKSVRDSERS